MSAQEIKIGFPPQGIMRYYLYSFLTLIDPHVKVFNYSDYVKLVSGDIKIDLKKAFERAKERLARYLQSQERQTKKQKKIVEIPASGNDVKIFSNLKKELNLATDASFLDVFSKYMNILDSINIVDLQAELYPFYGKKYSIPSIFNLELYGYTRGPYSNGEFSFEFNLSLHQFMLLLAGYIASRAFRARISEKEFVTAHLFPPSPAHLKNILFSEPKILSNKVEVNNVIEEIAESEEKPDSLYPIEAVILWFALNYGEYSDLYLVAVHDPGGMNPAKVALDIALPINSFYTRAKKFLDEIKKKDKLRNIFISLLREALNYPFTKSKPSEEAVNYVKLLFLACQEGRFYEKLELLLQSSRREIILLNSNVRDEEIKRRITVSNYARILAEQIR